MFKKLFFIALFVLAYSVSFAAYNTNYTALSKTMHYVNTDCGTNGDGKTWACTEGVEGSTGAYKVLPATLTRDHVYFMAGAAEHDGYTFDDARSGTLKIYIVRATIADHGTETGWADAFATGQVVFKSNNGSEPAIAWYVTNGYFEFNGKVGERDGSVTAHGFKLYVPTATCDSMVKSRILWVNAGAYPVEVYHTEIQNCQALAPYDKEQGSLADYGSANSIYGYNYIHDAQSGFRIVLANTGTFEYNYLKDILGTGTTHHGDGMNTSGSSDDYVIRFNIFESASGGGGTIKTTTGDDDWKIYGNLFFGTGGGDGSITTGDDEAPTGHLIYNNTIVTTTDSNRISQGVGSGWIVKNNLFDGTGRACTISVTAENMSYNKFYNCSSWTAGTEHSALTSTPFLGSGTDPYNLKAGSEAIDVGTALVGADYAFDILGTARPQGTGWDVGAYESTDGSTYYTLTVTLAGTGTGEVTSAPSGITCGADCTELYLDDTEVTLTATPADGSTFAGWSGTGGCTGTSTCILTMGAAKAATATFNITVSGHGGIKTGPGGNVKTGPGGNIKVGN